MPRRTPAQIPKPRLTQVIAERELRLVIKGRRRQKVLVRFGRPRVFDRPDNYACTYQIDGLRDEPITRRLYGGDSVQALRIALEIAMVELVTSAAYREGRLTWEGAYDLGLPVVDALRGDIRPDPKTDRLRRKFMAEFRGSAKQARRTTQRRKRP